jgi:hypothetical protein
MSLSARATSLARGPPACQQPVTINSVTQKHSQNARPGRDRDRLLGAYSMLGREKCLRLNRWDLHPMCGCRLIFSNLSANGAGEVQKHVR